jgi:hypothetical protein
MHNTMHLQRLVQLEVPVVAPHLDTHTHTHTHRERAEQGRQSGSRQISSGVCSIMLWQDRAKQLHTPDHPTC